MSKLSERLLQLHQCGDVGGAVEGCSEMAEALEDEITRLRALLEGGDAVGYGYFDKDSGRMDGWVDKAEVEQDGHVFTLTHTPKLLYTHPAPVVPEDYVLVPIEPTQHMIDEARYSRTCWVSGKDDSGSIYKAMLSAAMDDK
jgi:hypothetical protein